MDFFCLRMQVKRGMVVLVFQSLLFSLIRFWMGIIERFYLQVCFYVCEFLLIFLVFSVGFFFIYRDYELQDKAEGLLAEKGNYYLQVEGFLKVSCDGFYVYREVVIFVGRKDGEILVLLCFIFRVFYQCFLINNYFKLMQVFFDRG